MVLHGNGEDRFRCIKDYTDETKAELIRQTYRKCTGFIEGMEYGNIPVYMRLVGFKEYEIPPNGSKETSYTMHDYYKSNIYEKFKKGLSRLQRVQLDPKMIGVILVVVAVVAGCVFLFGGR